LFTNEIKADRDLNVQLQSYTSVIECGNQYNSCIQNECGPTFNKCLGKTAQDRAIKACEKIAKNCTEQDSGLSQRVGNVIGILRVNAEKDVKTDEQRLYDIRDLMRSNCQKFGAMFDERSFDCVYTVNFFTGANQQYPTASRKRYAGDTFICMQEWFGTNATTFKENAYRETRSQTAASSAMLGSGVGTAAGLITSGAINRALDTQKAKKELKEECDKQPDMVFKNGKCITKVEAEEQAKDPKYEKCKNNGGINYIGGICYCPEHQKWDKNTEQCVDTKMEVKKQACEDAKAKFVGGICYCPKGLSWSNTQNTCIDKKEKYETAPTQTN
jgi:hypothetical protein